MGAIKRMVPRVCVIMCAECACAGLLVSSAVEPWLGYSRLISLTAQIQTANCGAGFLPQGQTNTMRQKMAEGIFSEILFDKESFSLAAWPQDYQENQSLGSEEQVNV